MNLPHHGSLIAGSSSNSVTYSPTTGFIGADSFTYKATNGQGVDSKLATTQIKINAAHKGHHQTAPTAIIGPDQTVSSGAVVTLDGSASNDRDGDQLTYSWHRYQVLLLH